MSQCSVCVKICDLNPEVIEKFQANKTVQLVTVHWKFPEIHTRIFEERVRDVSRKEFFVIVTNVCLKGISSRQRCTAQTGIFILSPFFQLCNLVSWKATQPLGVERGASLTPSDTRWWAPADTYFHYCGMGADWCTWCSRQYIPQDWAEERFKFSP